MVIAKKDNVEVTLYTNGRLLVTPATDKETVRGWQKSFTLIWSTKADARMKNH